MLLVVETLPFLVDTLFFEIWLAAMWLSSLGWSEVFVLWGVVPRYLCCFICSTSLPQHRELGFRRNHESVQHSTTTISIRQSSYSRKHRKNTHLSGFWTAPFWTTSFLGNRRIIRNSKILWRAVPSNRSVWILSIWPVWSHETRGDEWGWVHKTPSSFNPLLWLQPLAGVTTNILWLRR